MPDTQTDNEDPREFLLTVPAIDFEARAEEEAAKLQRQHVIDYTIGAMLQSETDARIHGPIRYYRAAATWHVDVTRERIAYISLLREQLMTLRGERTQLEAAILRLQTELANKQRALDVLTCTNSISS